jgi:hypothetical protein
MVGGGKPWIFPQPPYFQKGIEEQYTPIIITMN